jgi:hypothetical protein
MSLVSLNHDIKDFTVRELVKGLCGTELLFAAVFDVETGLHSTRLAVLQPDILLATPPTLSVIEALAPL